MRDLLVCEPSEIEFVGSAGSFCLPEDPLEGCEIVMATPEGAVSSSLSRGVHDEGLNTRSVKLLGVDILREQPTGLSM